MKSKQLYNIKKKLEAISNENSYKKFKEFCMPLIQKYIVKYAEFKPSEIEVAVIDGISNIILNLDRYKEDINISGEMNRKITQNINKISKENDSGPIQDYADTLFYELDLGKTSRQILDEVTKDYPRYEDCPINKEYKIASYFYGLGTPSAIERGELIQEDSKLDYSKPHSLQETLKAFFPKDNREFLVKSRLKHFNETIKDLIQRLEKKKI